MDYPAFGRDPVNGGGKLWKKEATEMKKIFLIGLVVIFAVIFAAAMAGCASTTYLVEREKWPAFDTIIVEKVKVAKDVKVEGAEGVSTDVVAELNEILFAKLKEDLGGKYKVIHDSGGEYKNAMRLSFEITLWWEPGFKIAIPPLRPWGMTMEIVSKIHDRDIFNMTLPIAAGMIHSRNYFLKGSSILMSREINRALTDERVR